MFFLSRNASKQRLLEAERARNNRLEIVAALSQGQITRRELIKAGIFTAGGLLAWKHGLNPFVSSAFASSGSVPTGTPRSPYPFPGDQPFIQPLLRCQNLTSHKLTSTGGSDAWLLWPKETGEIPAMRRANTEIIRHTVNLANATNTGNVTVAGTTGPREGRAPGEAFAHQRWNELVNKAAGADGQVSHPLDPVGFVMSLGQVVPNTSFNFANNWHGQEPSRIWTFCEGRFDRGHLPPCLMQARYGESVINRIYNNMPFFDPQFGSANFPNVANTTNGGFGRQEAAIHNHNGHNGAESDGATNTHFFPGQYYDYNYSLMMARRDGGLRDSRGRDLDKLLKVRRGDPRCSTPTNDGGIIPIPGDFREIQGSLWFHDHRISFTSENVYKGYAALLEYFSGTDRGYERPLDNPAANKVNLRLPSGWRNAKTWGNRDFDVYLLIQDVAMNPDAQLFFDIFDTDGFLGDVMHVNYQWKPTMAVLPRKYRFRTLSAGMSRWVKLAVSDSLDPGKANPVPLTIIANDGNIFPQFVRGARELDMQGTAERYDFVLDFSKFKVGQKLYLVNMLKFSSGKGPDTALTLRDALTSKAQSDDPCLGAIMEFRIASEVPSIDEPGAMNTIANSCGANDMSLINDPGADWEIPTVEPVRTRVIELVRGADGGGLPFDHPEGSEPWGIKVNGGAAYNADMRRVSNLPRPGDVEHWTVSTGNGWGHPLHLHFEEGKTIGRTRGLSAMERNKRKDVWHVGSMVGNVTFQVAFGEFGGAYVNHCHNTVHEDNAMLMRYDIIRGNSNANGIDAVHITVLPTPDPRPEGVSYVDSCYLKEGNPQGFDTGVDVCGDKPEIGPVVPSHDPRTL
ncbi:multicopper oxidase domain-containing protein [Aromatoleum toluvorans]|uniref:Multicopper oxidase domain-containing protein n=1 Tax=Aromatoleum toluvorans TaxID=92002 RepID=A0ABX1Q1I6_9RHOO|nr:multicopper oxidase domain-containing protein [Aromatoleum toluvorans]NMG44364.1 multicopper oxidase domain-containing protein [Aromatoleum toluvorans]